MRPFFPTIPMHYEISVHAHRHWCPVSEHFTGGDALLSQLDGGWLVEGAVERRRYDLSGGRSTCVYHVTMVHGTARCEMQVVENPFVARWFRRHHILVVEFTGFERLPQPALKATI